MLPVSDIRTDTTEASTAERSMVAVQRLKGICFMFQPLSVGTLVLLRKCHLVEEGSI